MPPVLDWNATGDPSDLVRRVRETLAGGSAVVLPGDVGYVALFNPSAPNPQSRTCPPYIPFE